MLIAFAGIVLSTWLGNPLIDGIASILIGIVLTIIAILMIIETRNLLIGESAGKELVESTEKLIQQDDDVFHVQTP